MTVAQLWPASSSQLASMTTKSGWARFRRYTAVPAAGGVALHGWRRLARFQSAAVYPSMTSAATALGLHHIALTEQVQRLERDTAGPHYERAAYGKPQRLTPHGQVLLLPSTNRHRGRATCRRPGPPPPPPDPATIDTLRTDLSTRSAARPAAPYPGLAVQQERRTATTLAVVATAPTTPTATCGDTWSRKSSASCMAPSTSS